MNDKPPASSGTGSTGIFKRVVRAIRGEPWSREEIQDLFQHSDNVFAPEEQEMLSGVLEVAEIQVRDVMVPRAQMVVIGRDQSLDDMLQVIVESGHSRFPVIGEDRDEIVGILLAKDLLRFFSNPGETQLRLDRFIRPAVVIPESKRLNALLKEFRDSHNHMAIVVDEYGGVSGLLTIEDVLEEIVGEIGDEHDPAVDMFIQQEADRDGRACYAVRALTRIEDFNEYFNAQLPDEDYDTVGGLVMAQLGRLPRRGDVVQFGDFEFRVTKADRRRVDTLQVQRAPGQDR
ncbi:MAG TPA: transporter associated domain-containing protein [Woeseiaceae bacterium]|nr:transporter associated domain-containing protein [Woeseiaceae bacterium]